MKKVILLGIATYFFVLSCSVLISYKSYGVKMSKSPNIGNDDKLPVDLHRDKNSENFSPPDSLKVKQDGIK